MNTQLRSRSISYRLLAFSLFLASTPIQAATLFSDDFESGTLNAWAVNYSGQVVSDPLNSGNKALNFDSITFGGDLWSGYVPYTLGSSLTLSFDYLQTLVEGEPVNPFAYIGTDHNIGSWTFSEQWLLSSGGSATYSGMENLSFDMWHHVVLTFQPRDPQAIGTIVLKLEQFGGIPGNAFFDNIVLSDGETTPEPAAWTLFAGGLVMAIASKFRRRS